MGDVCNTHENLFGCIRTGDCLKDIFVGRRIILKCVCENVCDIPLAVIGYSGGVL
jgi:hypothetical protein